MPARRDYRIGWICALPLEMAAAQAVLDNIHPQLPNAAADRNNYVLGNIGDHNVVIACLPAGIYGTTSTTSTVIQMRVSYECIQCCLLVGIGGGVGTSGVESDIRLGDVVVSEPTIHYGGVIQYDYGKAVHGGQFVPTGTLDKPPEVVLKALARLKAQHIVHGSTTHLIYQGTLTRYPSLRENFSCPDPAHDRLFVANYSHEDPSTSSCDQCTLSMLQSRPCRHDNKIRVFYGLIASANQVVKDAKLRDHLAQRYGVLCFEMEAAGLMNIFPSLVIRGICDYSDSHKNKRWQGYAAMAAAAYAKELINFLPLHDLVNSGELDKIPTHTNQGGVPSEEDKQETSSPFSKPPAVLFDNLESAPPKESESKTRETSLEIHDTLFDRENTDGNFAINSSLNLSLLTSYKAEAEQNACEGSMKFHNTYPNQGRKIDTVYRISEDLNNTDPRLSTILERIIPQKDPQEIFDIRFSMTCKEGFWHPWPGDCIDVFYALNEWLSNVSPPLILTHRSGTRTRVQDLIVEVIKFLIQWKERSGSDYQVLWALGLSSPERPKNELLKSFIFSISKAYPNLFHGALFHVEARCDAKEEEEALWLLLQSVLPRITHAFVIVDPEDYLFFSRMLNVAKECYNNGTTRKNLRFLIAFHSMTNTQLIETLHCHQVIMVPPLPPQARMRSLTRKNLGWDSFKPKF